MKLGISIDSLAPQLSGIGRYTWELCNGLQVGDEISSIEYYRHSEWTKNPYAFLDASRGNRHIVPKKIRSWSANRKFRDLLFHGTNYFIPDPVELGISTVHDLSVFLFPETHPASRISQFDREFEKTLRKSAQFITDSEAVRQELITHFNVDEARTTSIPLGVSAAFKLRDRLTSCDYVSRALGRPLTDYILSVATFEPRKRIENAIRAHADMCDRTGWRIPLVLVGSKGWENAELHNLIEVEERSGLLIFAGFVTESDLPVYYSGASLFLYPSIYEGFGLPPIEAMACGIPTIVANRSCLPEVTMGAACYVDPDDIDGFSMAIENCILDDVWRTKIIADGLRVAANYTWEKCVKETLKTYRKVLSL